MKLCGRLHWASTGDWAATDSSTAQKAVCLFPGKEKLKPEEKRREGMEGMEGRDAWEKKEEKKRRTTRRRERDAMPVAIASFFLSFSPLFPFLYSVFPLLSSSPSSLSMLFIHWTSSQNECARPPGKEEADERVEQVQVPPPYTYTVVRSTAMKRIAMTSII